MAVAPHRETQSGQNVATLVVLAASVMTSSPAHPEAPSIRPASPLRRADGPCHPVSGRSRPVAGLLHRVGYGVVGTVRGTAFGDLTMLKLPDDDFVMIEIVSGPSGDGAGRGSGLSQFVVKVESLDVTMADLAAAVLDVAARAGRQAHGPGGHRPGRQRASSGTASRKSGGR